MQATQRRRDIAPSDEATKGGATTTRRGFLAAAAGMCAAGALGVVGAEPAGQRRTRLGIVTYALGLHLKAKPGLSDPLEFVNQCHRMGAGGAQLPLGILDVERRLKFRRNNEVQPPAEPLRIEAILDLPGDDGAIDRFEQQILTAKSCRAEVGRVVAFPGRRYEQFSSAQQFAEASRRALEMLQRAEPIARKHKFMLALENHKDQRIPQRLELLKKLSSEYIGACVDVGNSFALCEDPMETIRAYAPYALTVHLKDQAVREYEDGFLYADVPLGDGFLDLPEMVRILKTARPEVTFNYEGITRDPLRVPVFTEKYWATMADVPATHLSRTMRIARQKASKQPLPTLGGMPLEKQVQQEAENIRRSLGYARDKLGI